MRVIVLIALAGFTLAILIGVFIYDKTKRDRMHKMLLALKKLHTGTITTKKSINMVSLVKEYPTPSDIFNITLDQLRNEDYITVEGDKIKFTSWGKNYYETKVENVRG